MSALYDNGRNAFARGEIAWKASGGSTIKAQLIDTEQYTVDLALHVNLEDVPAGARIGSPVALTLLDPVAGVCDAQDVLFRGVPDRRVEALILYQDTGSEATSTLIAYIDTATGLPFQTAGGEAVIVWSNGVNKIFKL